MTLLVAWIGVDSRVPSSAYIATDSRLSWTGGDGPIWDHGVKTFASRNTPDIFGYVGRTLFPTLFLTRFVEALEFGTFGPEGATLRERHSWMRSELRTAANEFPENDLGEFSIIHLGRAGFGQGTIFEITVTERTKGAFVSSRSRPVTASTVLKLGSAKVSTERERWVDGSGSQLMATSLQRWQESEHGGTSRAVFSAFCDSIRSERVRSVGGPPQLVGLRKIGNGRRFGVEVDGTSFVAGVAVQSDPGPEVEVFNGLFERVDFRGARLDGAAVHPPLPHNDGIVER